MEEDRGVYKVLVGRSKGKSHWEDLGIGGRLTLRWTLESQGSMGQTGFSWLRRVSSDRLL
jgi:hypothetical protein